MPRPIVVDLSHHNVVPESLRPARQAGVLGLIHKATEGTGFIDSKYGARRWLAKDAGLLFGAYHFLRPGNYENQVAHFLAYANPDDDMLLAVDHEDPKVGVGDLTAFIALLHQNGGRAPVLYSGHVLREQLAERPSPALARYRLWFAQYGPAADKLPAGFESYWLWQYTDQGNIPGITPPTDLNDYQGTPESLRLDWAMLTEQPQPEPEPPPEPSKRVVDILISHPTDVEVRVTQSVSVTSGSVDEAIKRWGKPPA